MRFKCSGFAVAVLCGVFAVGGTGYGQTVAARTAAPASIAATLMNVSGSHTRTTTTPLAARTATKATAKPKLNPMTTIPIDWR